MLKQPLEAHSHFPKPAWRLTKPNQPDLEFSWPLALHSTKTPGSTEIRTQNTSRSPKEHEMKNRTSSHMPYPQPLGVLSLQTLTFPNSALSEPSEQRRTQSFATGYFRMGKCNITISDKWCENSAWAGKSICGDGLLKSLSSQTYYW